MQPKCLKRATLEMICIDRIHLDIYVPTPTTGTRAPYVARGELTIAAPTRKSEGPQGEAMVRRVSKAQSDDRGHPRVAADCSGRSSRARGRGLPTAERDEAYGFGRETLGRFGYRGIGRRNKATGLAFLVAASGVSRYQMERLVTVGDGTGSAQAHGCGDPAAS